MSKKKSKYLNVVGIRPRKPDFAEWDTARFMNWFRLVHFFTLEDKLNVTDISIKAFKSRATENPFWEEWMYRFEIHTDKFEINTFLNRVITTTRIMGQFLQDNPHVITNDMKAVMEGNNSLKKYTEPYVVKETAIGAEIVAPNTTGKYTLPEVQYHNAILKLSAIANDLIVGIAKDDIKKMSPKERITLAKDLLTVMSRLQGGHRPNVQIFKQLIVNQAGKEDLESVMLEMAKMT